MEQKADRAEIQALRARVAELEFQATQRKHAAEAAERKYAAEAAEALARVGRELAGMVDLPQAAEKVVSTLLLLFRARRTSLFEFDPASGSLVCIATAGRADPAKWIGRTLEVGAGAAGRAFEEGRPVWSPDLLADSRIRLPEWQTERLRAEGFRSGVAVPVITRGGKLGALALGDTAGRVFSDDELRLLSAFAAQAGIAIQNARLFQETDRRRKAAEKLADLGRLIAQSLDPVEVAQQIADSARALLQVQVSIVYRLEPDAGDLVTLAFAGEPALEPNLVLSRGTGLAGLAVRKRQPVATQDLFTDPRLAFTPGGQAPIEGRYRAALAVPLLAQDTAIGALAVGGHAGRVFSDEDTRLAQAFADQAALALENARLFAESQRALADLNDAQEQLVRSKTLRAMGDLAAGATHHLNNLLAVILGRVQLLLPTVRDPEVRRSLAIVEEVALDGSNLVRRLEAFTRTRPLTEGMIPVDVNQVAREVLEQTRSSWQDESRGQRSLIEASLEPGQIPAVTGDPLSLRELLMNLLLNAVDALPEGGRIVVRTWASDHSVHCSVTDTGVGMTEEVWGRALEPFFTTKGPRRTGLGLSISYGIVQQHGGELIIDSAQGQGTTVAVRLPSRPHSSMTITV